MAAPESFVAELQAKNEASLEKYLAPYVAGLTAENFTPADLLRLELRAVVEATEVAALWLVDSESLEAKMALAAQCGDEARHHRLIGDRLIALGVDLASFDPRAGGYSKLFAFMRSLQTPEERASAGPLTLRVANLLRFRSIVAICDASGDTDSARIFRDIMSGEDRYVAQGRAVLVASALNEESQARARRAAFRTIELLTEILDPPALRKFLSRSMKK